MLHISIWGIEAFSEMLSGNGTGILGPLWQRAPAIGGCECGWYGSGCNPHFPYMLISDINHLKCKKVFLLQNCNLAWKMFLCQFNVFPVKNCIKCGFYYIKKLNCCLKTCFLYVNISCRTKGCSFPSYFGPLYPCLYPIKKVRTMVFHNGGKIHIFFLDGWKATITYVK